MREFFLVVFDLIVPVAVLGSVIWFYINLRRKVFSCNYMFHVKCEHCGGEYEINTQAFIKGKGQKSFSKTKSKVKGVVVDNTPQYSYCAKRFDCPHCNSKQWGVVSNYNEYNEKMKSFVIKWMIATVIMMQVVEGVSSCAHGVLD